MSDIAFPIYVLAKDDGSVLRFESLRDMRGYLEAIDVSNEEYELWDSRGQCLTPAVGELKEDWLKISQTGRFASKTDFSEICRKAADYPPVASTSKFREWLRRTLGTNAKG